ncbi:hypothetical protein CARUB_v10006064mg [Capsella rubella]|uniref:Prolamin-like domain-containing protein n=1 Tax=Capsella rubella TaxID=81985 RepID=R0H2G4_9BRAS|nr:hypothetical protein CARUB_v10006064mg [Capsella rubella]
MAHSILVAIVIFFGLIIMSSSSQISYSNNRKAMTTKEEEDPKGVLRLIHCSEEVKTVQSCFDAAGGIGKAISNGRRGTCCQKLNYLPMQCWPVLFPGKLFTSIAIKLVCLCG